MWKQAIAQELSQGKKQNISFFFLFTRKVKHITNQQWNRISIVVAGNTEEQSTVSQWDWQVQSPKWIWNGRDLVSFPINLSGLDGHRVCGRYSNAGFHPEACLCCSSWRAVPAHVLGCVCAWMHAADVVPMEHKPGFLFLFCWCERKVSRPYQSPRLFLQRKPFKDHSSHPKTGVKSRQLNGLWKVPSV